VILFLLVGAGFFILAIKSRRPQYSLRRKIEAGMQDEKAVRSFFLAGAGLVLLSLFLLTRQVNFYRDFKLMYVRLEPVIAWIFALGIESAFLAAVWYCAFFLPAKRQPDFAQTRSEISALFGIYAAFVLLKILLVTSTSYGPLGRGDEMTYFDMAESFYRGFFSIAQTHHYPPLYPLALVPALVLRGTAFDGFKLLNVLYSSSLIFPVYFLARQFLDHKHSLMASLLTCLIPYHLVFPRRILSENLFLPLFVWTCLVTFSVPRNGQRRKWWDILNGVLIAALYLTRYITLSLIPFFLLAWWAKPFEGELSLFKPGKQKALHCLLLLAALLLTFSPWLISAWLEDLPLKLALGFGVASKPDPEQLTLARFLEWVALYGCYYVLVAAPVFNLLLVSLTQFETARWRENSGRLIFQVLALMAGFYAAVARHSWRALYNQYLPTKIMGRYLIIFSVLYLILAVLVLVNFDRKRIKSPLKFTLLSGVLPFGLVVLSNFILIEGKLIATSGNLFKALGSVDGFLTEILGPYFFVMLAVIYALETFLLLTNQRRWFLPAFTVCMLAYYLSGVPAYYDKLLEYQTYPWLSMQIARQLPAPDFKNQRNEKISVFIPKEDVLQDSNEIYNGLRVRGIDNSYIFIYPDDAVEEMPTASGFIIERIHTEQSEAAASGLYEFNGEFFRIQGVSQP